MRHDMLWYWLGLFGLGAFHGINPSMGWLFAVALGMQERNRRGVWRALLPLGLGHVLSVGGVILVAIALGVVLPLHDLKWVVVFSLIGLGTYKLIRSRHPRWAAMQVGMGDLTLWSFLMATAHGAGLMVLPLFMTLDTVVSASSGHAAHMAAATAGGAMIGLLATLVHGAGYLLVTGVVAILVFDKFGLGFLRKAWVNLDLIWAVVLIATGALILLI